MPPAPDPPAVRTRRGVLAAGLTLLAGCSNPTGSGSQGCGELRSEGAVSADRVTDLVIANDRTAPVDLELTVDGPGGRRCATLHLAADDRRSYRRVFEDGGRYTVSVDVTTAPEASERHETAHDTYAVRGLHAEVGSDDVSFAPYVR